MKPSPVYSIMKKIALAGFALFFALRTLAPASYANIEGDKTDPIFDKFENWVKSTGIPEIKRQLFETHQVLFKPYFKQGYTLTSNPFSVPKSQKKSESYFTFTPGFESIYQQENAVMGLSYEASFDYFTHYHSQNEQNQNFLIFADFFPTQETYIRTSERIDRQGAIAANQFFEPVDYLDNTVNAVGGYTMGNWTNELGYENYNRRYQQDMTERFNYNENKADYRFYRKINDSLRAFAGTRIGFVEYDKTESRDAFYFEIPFGIEGTLPYGVIASAAIGPYYRNQTAEIHKDYKYFVSSLSLQKTINQGRTSFEANFIRRPVESAFENTTIYDEKMFQFQVKQLLTKKIRGRASLFFGGRDFEESSLTGTRFLIGTTTFVSTETKERTDGLFGFGFGVDFRVRKWLIFNVDYSLQRRNSNVAAMDYTDNRFSVGTTIPL